MKNASTQNGEVTGGNANLRPFAPGQSGNPGGRPKKAPVTDYVKSQLEAAVPASMLAKMKPEAREDFAAVYGETPTFGQMVAYRLIAQAASGDVSAVRELLDRVEGKVTKPMSLSGDGDEGKLVVRVLRVGVEGV